MSTPQRYLMPASAMTAAAAMILLTAAAATWSEQPTTRVGAVEVRVGIDDSDIRGSDHRALQAAVDYAAKLGGGTVRIGPGQYQMRNALILRDNVHVSGDPRKAICCLAFPVVGGWNVKNAGVEGLTIDGNQAKAEYVDGCRAGGIYLFESDNISVRHCVVRNYKGDGISFQVSQHVTVEDCLCENNTGLGIHPGSGSQHPVVRRNRSLNNGDDGLYVCWRVKHGRFEDNEIRGNHGVGVSIGHKDTDNLFRGNLITANAKAGVLFREESQPMGAHRNVFESNRILDNGAKEGNVSIVIRGHHDDLVFRKNTIGCSKTASPGVGIRCAKESNRFQ